MRLALTGRNLDITPALRQLVTRKLTKLDRLLHEGIISAQVVLSIEKHRRKTDILVRTRGDHALSGHGEDGAWQTSVSGAITKLEQQVGRLKGRRQSQQRRVDGARRRATTDGVEVGVPAGTTGVASTRPSTRRQMAALAPVDETPQSRVIRVRRTSPKPMLLEDAILRVDEKPGSVLVFRDSALDRVQVLVRRADGHLGLVDPDA